MLFCQVTDTFVVKYPKIQLDPWLVTSATKIQSVSLIVRLSLASGNSGTEDMLWCTLFMRWYTWTTRTPWQPESEGQSPSILIMLKISVVLRNFHHCLSWMIFFSLSLMHYVLMWMVNALWLNVINAIWLKCGILVRRLLTFFEQPSRQERGSDVFKKFCLCRFCVGIPVSFII